MPDKLRALKMHADLCGFFDRPARKPIEVPNPLQKFVEELRAGRGNIAPPKRKRSTKLNLTPSPQDDTDPSSERSSPSHQSSGSHQEPATPETVGPTSVGHPQNPSAPYQTITSTPGAPNPPSEIRDPQSPDSYPRIRPKSPKTLELERMRASWTPSPMPYAYPGDLPGVKRKPKCVVIR